LEKYGSFPYDITVPMELVEFLYMIDMFRLMPIMLLVFLSCKESRQSNPAPIKDSAAVVKDTAVSTSSTHDSVSSIRNRVEYINTAKALEQKHVEFMCDEKTKVDYFYDNGEVVKIAVDFGWVGDAYAREGYYYDKGKLIFIYEYVESGPACDDCIEKHEYRSYVVNDKVAKYLKDQTEGTCRSHCEFNASSRHYKLLEAKTTAEIKAVLCR